MFAVKRLPQADEYQEEEINSSHLINYEQYNSRRNLQKSTLKTDTIGMDDNQETVGHKRPDIPIWEKSSLSIDEAAEYCGVGRARLRELTEREDCPFVLWVGSKRLIRRKKLDEYLDRAFSI